MSEKKLIRYEHEWPWGFETVFVYEDGLGYVGVAYDEFVSFGFIHDLCVHPSTQKTGRGNELLRTAEEDILRHGWHTAVLRVVPDSWTQGWYEKHGYEVWADAPGHQNGWNEMRKRL